MASTSTVTCDRCGQSTSDGGTLFRADSGPGRQRLPDGLDLCPTCFDRLLGWLAAGQADTDTIPTGSPTR